VRREPVVPLIMAIDVVANLGSAGTTEVALPLLAREHLHAGAGGYGALIASAGIGAQPVEVPGLRNAASCRAISSTSFSRPRSGRTITVKLTSLPSAFHRRMSTPWT
jgi:hypothetical protein